MEITNKHGLPQAFVDAVTNDPYDNGGSDISATSLIDAPQRRALLREHRSKITEDVADRVWALLGSAVHHILEQAEDEHAVVEERLFAEVDGWKVSGQFDRYLPSTGTIQDWKVTTVYKAQSSHADWERQLNVLAWLARQNGMAVSKLQICAIMRDWAKSRSLQDGSYPSANVMVIDIPLWDDAVAEEYVYERVALHQEARNGNAILCTDDERWYSGDSWAVKKPTSKRAHRVYKTKEEAEANCPDSMIVEHRPGEYKRCQQYCEAAPWCAQWQLNLEESFE
jgi:hypothetical protein